MEFSYVILSIKFLYNTRLIFSQTMKPNRPDSAKSAKTRITIDSEYSSNNLTQSKFSETYSNGVKSNNDKNNDFHKYVAEKNKDPKFKKFQETNLSEIPQQTKHSNELAKLTSKPFERKTSKNQKQKGDKKLQQPPKKIEQQVKQTKKQNLQNSKTFIDRSKQKLKISSKQQIDQKNSAARIQQQEQDNKQKNIGNSTAAKTKINLNGFVLNIPGKAPKIIMQQKIEQKAAQNEQMKKERERQNIMMELSQYVQDIQQKNVEYLPKRYNEFIESNLNNKDVDLQKIRIDQYLWEPNERDYENLMKKINENEQQLQLKQKVNNKGQNNSSINLQQIIDGPTDPTDIDESSSVMSEMTAQDVRDRNMFLTQILKGRRVTGNQISQIKENNQTMCKLIKLQNSNKQPMDDEQVEIVQINMNKKKNGKFIQRNKYEAAGELYRECDLLTPEEQKRIEDLINGIQIQSPFLMSEMESFMSRRIDEGIKLHRQLCQNIQGINDAESQIVIGQQTLPKDPLLRKNAQMKILKQKINSVNTRLANLNDVIANKAKIQNLINKCKETVRPSRMSQSLIQQKNKQIESQLQQLQQAESLLRNAQAQRGEILSLIDQLSDKFSTMEADVIKLQKMDTQQLRKVQQQKLQSKRKKIEEIQQQIKFFQDDIRISEIVGSQLKKNMDALDQIMKVNKQQLHCQGYNEGETIEEIDKLVTTKWEAAQQAIQNVRGIL